MRKWKAEGQAAQGHTGGAEESRQWIPSPKFRLCHHQQLPKCGLQTAGCFRGFRSQNYFPELTLPPFAFHYISVCFDGTKANSGGESCSRLIPPPGHAKNHQEPLLSSLPLPGNPNTASITWNAFDEAEEVNNLTKPQRLSGHLFAILWWNGNLPHTKVPWCVWRNSLAQLFELTAELAKFFLSQYHLNLKEWQVSSGYAGVNVWQVCLTDEHSESVI